jgi:hypothetical protein
VQFPASLVKWYAANIVDVVIRNPVNTSRNTGFMIWAPGTSTISFPDRAVLQIHMISTLQMIEARQIRHVA